MEHWGLVLKWANSDKTSTEDIKKLRVWPPARMSYPPEDKLLFPLNYTYLTKEYENV